MKRRTPRLPQEPLRWFTKQGAMSQVDRGALVRHYRIIQELAKRVPKGSVGLDVGCGEGTTIRLLEKYGYTMWGIDPRDYSASVPRFKRATGESIPFEDRSFDFVVLSHVLAHVQNADRFLAEVERVLRQGGYAFVIQTNRFSWERFVGHYIVGSDRTYHFRTFAWWTILDLFARAGLDVTSMKSAYYFHSLAKRFRPLFYFDITYAQKIPRSIATAWLVVAQKGQSQHSIPPRWIRVLQSPFLAIQALAIGIPLKIIAKAYRT